MLADPTSEKLETSSNDTVRVAESLTGDRPRPCPWPFLTSVHVPSIQLFFSYGVPSTAATLSTQDSCTFPAMSEIHNFIRENHVLAIADAFVTKFEPYLGVFLTHDVGRNKLCYCYAAVLYHCRSATWSSVQIFPSSLNGCRASRQQHNILYPFPYP
jgi:hypothetical protein